jgi:actin-like ATPase involved in cell morphogenesis
MTFGLGVDLGTTFTAGAVSHGDRLDMLPLGERTAAIPSVVMLRDGGTTLVGDAANRRATADPARVAREVKRRLGDPTPLILGGEPHSAAQILSRLLRAVVDAAAKSEGSRPDWITLTYPANWGPYKRELFDSVPRLADLTAVSMVTEPEAAAAHYASTARVPQGSTVAVYDLGGGTFDATVLRQLDSGFTFLGPPEGIEGLGGIDFDEAVFAHVDRSVDGALSELDLDDPQTAASLIRVRHDCVLAKEALSGDTETSIPVMLPDLHTEVRLTRAEFEEMIRAPIEATVSALRRALTAAEVAPEDLTKVLLVGGSSRIPLVSQMLSAELGRPTAIDTHPKHAVALGAALLAERGRAAAARPGAPARGGASTSPPGRRTAPGSKPAGSASTPSSAPRTPGRTPKAPVMGPAALADGATVVSKPSSAPTPSRPSRSGGVDSGPRSGMLPVVGPPSNGLRAMRPLSGAPSAPPSGPFRAPPPPTGPPPRAGEDHTAVMRERSSSPRAAGSAPPSLGADAAEAADTRRRRIRVAVICGVVAVVLAAGGVATAAALGGKAHGAPITSPPAAVAVPSVTTTPPAAQDATQAAPAAEQQSESGGGSQHSPTHHPTTTRRTATTTTPSKTEGDGSGGGSSGY